MKLIMNFKVNALITFLKAIKKTVKLTDAKIIDMVLKWSLCLDGRSDAVTFMESNDELAECFGVLLDSDSVWESKI